MTITLNRDLERLTSSGIELRDPAGDLRGRDVHDQMDEPIGVVADLLVDPAAREARLIELETAGGLLGFGKKRYLVPLEAVTGNDARTIYLDRIHDDVVAGPEYRPATDDEEEAQYAAAYQHYGIPPYWEHEAHTPSVIRG